MDASRMAEIIKVVKSVNADCLALQEVNSYTKGATETSYTFHEWQKQIMVAGNYNYSYFLATDKIHKPYYGIGLLTKKSPLRVVTKLFPNSNPTSTSSTNDYGEGRGLIMAEFEDYYYIGAHFSLVASYRKTMVDWVVDTIQSFTKPVFIAGDFNMTWTTTPMPYLKAGGLNTNISGTQYTFSTASPNKCIDFIITHDKTKYAELGMAFTDLGHGLVTNSGADLVLATDHFPIYAKFQLSQIQSSISRVENDVLFAKSMDKGILLTDQIDIREVYVYTVDGACIYQSQSQKKEMIPLQKMNRPLLILVKTPDSVRTLNLFH